MLSGRRAEVGSIQGSIEDIQDLANAFTGAESDIDKFNDARKEIISKYPELANVLSGEVDNVNQLANAYSKTLENLTKYNEAKVKQARREAHAGIDNARKTYNSATRQYANISTTGNPLQMDDLITWYNGYEDPILGSLIQSSVGDGTIAQLESRIDKVRKELEWLEEQA